MVTAFVIFTLAVLFLLAWGFVSMAIATVERRTEIEEIRGRFHTLHGTLEGYQSRTAERFAKAESLSNGRNKEMRTRLRALELASALSQASETPHEGKGTDTP